MGSLREELENIAKRYASLWNVVSRVEVVEDEKEGHVVLDKRNKWTIEWKARRCSFVPLVLPSTMPYHLDIGLKLRCGKKDVDVKLEVYRDRVLAFVDVGCALVSFNLVETLVVAELNGSPVIEHRGSREIWRFTFPDDSPRLNGDFILIPTAQGSAVIAEADEVIEDNNHVTIDTGDMFLHFGIGDKDGKFAFGDYVINYLVLRKRGIVIARDKAMDVYGEGGMCLHAEKVEN